jgi:hypothetical protein
MEFLDSISAWFGQASQVVEAFFSRYQLEISILTRVVSVLSIIATGLTTCLLVLILPIRVRMGALRIDALLKLIVFLGIFAWCFVASYVVIFQPFIIIAKLAIINVMLVGIIVAWTLLLSWPRISLMLTAIQQECELANNLTFLQAEMARSQLEALNMRIQQAIQPEEREVTETMLRTLSPIVTMFLKKERSILKWSYAAVDVGRTMMRHFFSDKK